MLAILFGILLMGLGCYLWRRHRKFFKHAILVPGAISSYTTYESKGEHGHKTTMYTPVISFEFDGKSRTVSYPISSSSKPEIGKAYQVGVNPYNIEEARVYSKGEIAAIWIVTAMGLILLFLGIAIVCGKI